MFESLWRLIKSVNRKVWVTAAFLAVIFTAGISWIIISNAAAAFKPANWDGLSLQAERATVSGNGGPAVMVGNWLYFVGNYVDSSTIKYRQNEYNKVSYGAIYRVYIESGSVSPLYEDIGELSTNPDYVTHLLDESRYDLIVPKVAGFDQASLWVFDRHLVYTSPNNTKDRLGQLQLSKIDFFRVDLDGRNHRKIYTTVNDSVSVKDYTVASYAGKVFLLIKDGQMLRRVSVTDNPGRISSVSENVESVALPVVTSYHIDYDFEQGKVIDDKYSILRNYEGIMTHVYYTEALDEEEQEVGLQGNRLFQYSVPKDTKVDAYINGHTVTVKALANGRLIYSVSTADAQYGAGNTSLGIFMTDKPISEENTAPFDITPKNGQSKCLYDFILLEEWAYNEDEIYLPTVITPDVTFRFTTLVEGKMYFYENGKQQFIKMISGVSSVITVTGSAVHYLNSDGAIRAVSLDGDEIAMASAVPETSVRPWLITRNSTVWYFHIKTLEEEQDADHEHSESDVHESTTVAALFDVSGDLVREFILGRVDDIYFE